MEHAAAGLLLALILITLLVRYVFWSIDQERDRLAQIESDPDLRRKEILRLDTHIAAHPEDLAALRLRADALSLEEEWSRVAEDLETCVRINAKDDTAWGELAEAQIRLNRPQPAIEAARQAIGIDANYLDHHAALCRALLLAEDIPGARSAWNTWHHLAEQRHQTRDVTAPRRIANWLPRISPLENPYLHLTDALLLSAEGDSAAAQTAIQRAKNSPHAPDPETLETDPLFGRLPLVE